MAPGSKIVPVGQDDHGPLAETQPGDGGKNFRANVWLLDGLGQRYLLLAGAARPVERWRRAASL